MTIVHSCPSGQQRTIAETLAFIGKKTTVTKKTINFTGEPTQPFKQSTKNKNK